MDFKAYHDKLIKEYKFSTTYRVRNNNNGFDEIKDLLDSQNEDYGRARRAMFPKLHDFVKENGIPSEWPMGSGEYFFAQCPEDLPERMQGKRIGVQFHFMADDFKPLRASDPTGRFFRNLFKEVIIKTGVADRTPYIPSSGIIRDKEYGEISRKADSLKNESEYLSRKIKEAEKRADEYNGTGTFGDLLFTVMVAGFFRMLLVAFITLIIVSAIFVSAWYMIPHVGSAQVAPIFITVCSIVVGGILAYLIAIKPLSKNFAQQKANGIDLRSMKRRLKETLEEREKLLSTERYKAAKARQQKLAKEDQDLAIRWQNEWKEAILREEPNWLYIEK